MAKKSGQPATYADIEALPEHLVGELIDGELFTSPRPTPIHSEASLALGTWLRVGFQNGTADRRPTWRFLIEPELHLGPNVFVPDLAGWHAARMPEVPKSPYIELDPDWLCEVASPSTARLDRAKKLPLYARAGVNHTWLVDPSIRTLDAFRREGDRWLLLGTWSENDRATIEPFDELELELAQLWGNALPAVHDGGPSYKKR